MRRKGIETKSRVNFGWKNCAYTSLLGRSFDRGLEGASE